MILTDRMIDYVDYTINDLVKASFLPISVIVIGIGKADFTTMNILQKLAEETLADIPKQMVEYYEQNNIEPNDVSCDVIF